MTRLVLAALLLAGCPSPMPGKWGKLLLWTALALLAVILVATHVLRLG